MFERFDEPRPLGSGLMLQPTGLAVLDRLGLAHDTAERGSRIDGLLGLTVDGRQALYSPYARLDRHAFGIGIHRASLFDMLYATAHEANIEIRVGHEVIGTEIDTRGRVLHFAGRPACEAFELVVDATGWHTRLDGPTRGLLDFGALWATLPLSEDDPFADNLLEQRYRKASQMVGVLPIGKRSDGGHREVAFFWSLRRDDYEGWRRAGLDAWKDDVRALWPATQCLLERISTPEQLTFATYAHRTTSCIHGDRLFRIGDAWHSASPQLGQGVNMALLDAWALAMGLEQGRTLDEGLRLARAWRSDHVGLYQALTRFFTPLYQSDAAWHATIRDRFLMPMSRYWPASKIQAQMMSGMFGSPLQTLGLSPPDFTALASRWN